MKMKTNKQKCLELWLWNTINPVEYLKWELYDELQSLPFISSITMYYEVSIYLKRKITIEELEKMYDLFECVLVGYTLDEKSSEKSLCFNHPKKDSILIKIYNDFRSKN